MKHPRLELGVLCLGLLMSACAGNGSGTSHPAGASSGRHKRRQREWRFSDERRCFERRLFDGR